MDYLSDTKLDPVSCDDPDCWYCTGDRLAGTPAERWEALKKHAKESLTFATRLLERLETVLEDEEEECPKH